MSVSKKIQVCFSTAQFNKFADMLSTVVIIDVLRATSVISTAFECGIDSVIPVTTLEQALQYKNVKNHIIAAERNTLAIEGFDYGNSPFHYINSNVLGKTLALTTTNGTKAIHLAKGHEVITASFINIDAVVNYLVKSNNDVIIFCSGWKGIFNLEDSIFAGALAEKLLRSNAFTSDCDSLYSSIQLYLSAKEDLFDYLKVSSYRKRNSSAEVIKDTRFCLNPSIKSNIVPIFIKGKLVDSNKKNNY
jgi:2-phosphosulfolactate phosphatase